MGLELPRDGSNFDCREDFAFFFPTLQFIYQLLDRYGDIVQGFAATVFIGHAARYPSNSIDIEYV